MCYWLAQLHRLRQPIASADPQRRLYKGDQFLVQAAMVLSGAKLELLMKFVGKVLDKYGGHGKPIGSVTASLR